MEKSSAARAMGWSIDLEKGLRSKRLGHPIESVHKMGPRLKQWSMEPQLTIPVYNMLGLVPGEDRLFGDAIILRLAGAFVTGDNATRIAIIKVFMSTRSHSMKKDARGHGIFSNLSLEIRLELLRRVKVLLSAECIESRSLVLILLGCWADIIKDIAEIRHAILSSLVSSHVMEVKAALFASGCFAEVSDDFASVFLERLLNLVTSPKTSPAVKIAGARALSKVNYTLLLTIKSYKAGAELVINISEEDILATMLMSLTKLSCKAVILISEQVDLLSSFLAKETSLHMQASVLRCLRCLAEKAICFVPISSSLIHAVLKIFDEPNTPSPQRCDVLRIFLKIIAYELPDMQLPEINGFTKLLRYVKDATQSPFFSERLLAFEVLVCISNKMKGRSDLMSDRNDSGLLSEVVLAVCDQITRLINPASDGTLSSEIKQELRSMLKFLLVLVENHPELGYVILDKSHSIIRSLVNSHNISTTTIQSSPAHKSVTPSREKGDFPMRMFMFQIHSFLVAFLDILDDTRAVTDQVGFKLKDLISFVSGSSLFDCSIHTFYGLLLHYNLGSLFPKDKETNNSLQIIGEMHICECAGNMVGGDNWYAYRAGKFSACEGVWNVANMIFQHLETRVKSQFCCEWLKFLVQFTHLEKNAQMLLQQACHSLPQDNCDHMDVILSGYSEKFREIGDDLSSSDKVLEPVSVQTQVLYFQRWFLAVRVKVLLVLADILKFLDNIRQQGGNDISFGDPLLQAIKGMNGISSTLTRLAEEFDLITSSFIDMDSKSVKMISSLALSCSILGFCIEFTNLAVDSHVLNPTEKISDSLCVIVRDLAKRLWYPDSDTRKSLMSFLKECGVNESSLHLQPIFSKVGCISDDILAVCNYCVQEIIRLWHEFLKIRNMNTILQGSKDCILLLQNVVASLMRIPFRIPEYFFRVRPSIGSILICSNASNRKNMPIATLGSHLSLNLCIQLKNMPEDISSYSKIYCILYCKTKTTFSPCGEFQTGYQASKTEMAINLNKKLQCYVMKYTRESNCRDLQRGDDGEIEAYVCFKTKGRDLGYSTCLLDVSAFPVGSYGIHWQCGFVDGFGTFRNLLPLNSGPVFSVVRDSLSHK